MLNNLPLEVLEIICFYVEVEDLVNVWDAVGMDGSDSFWKKICKRQGYINIVYKNSSWKSVFEQNMNWLTQQYEKRTYKLDSNNIDVRQTRSSQGNVLLWGKHLIANSIGKETLVWDLSSSPNLVLSLSAKYISHKGNKLVTYNLSEIEVYSCNIQNFSKLYELPVRMPISFHKCCSFTEDYFATFDQNTSYIKIIDLRELKEFSLVISSTTMPMVFSLTLSNSFLFILTLEGSTYKVKRFNLMDKTWLQDEVLFQYAALIGVPQLEISSSLIVSWSSQLEAPGITPVKVFGLDGTYIASIPFTSCLEPTGIKLLTPVENVLWMIVECDYLIFSTSKTTVSVWSLESLNYIKVIPKDDQLYNGQKVVSSSLLVLSYSYCFKVIDFKKSVYLYEVLFGNSSCSKDSFQSLNFVVNEYCYIYFQYVEEDEDNTKTSTNKMTPLSPNLHLNFDSKEISKKKCLLHIYDFSETYLNTSTAQA